MGMVRMRTTDIDLFRAGNASSARFEQLRIGEVTTEIRNGLEWVLPGTGGASTLDSPNGVRGKHFWKLPKGSEYDETQLSVQNDYGNHWSWEPQHEMPLREFLAALGVLNTKFIHL
jgi:hypothetical protein